MTAWSALPKRGGRVAGEVRHGERLIELGAESTWGWGSPAGQRRVAARIAWFRRELALAPGQRVLECGCGTGVFTRRLAASGASITAVDVSPALLARARQEVTAPNVTFALADLETVERVDGAPFDAICGVSVLHHLDNARALPRLHALLRPGGRIAFSEPNLLNPINRYLVFSRDFDRRRRYGASEGEMAFTPEELRRDIEAGGFAVDRLEHRDFLHPATPPALIPMVERLQRVAEAMPLVRRISGSLWVSATRRSA